MTTDIAAPLAGKTALVTGGSRGIGAAIVRRLAAEGARVAFTYRSRADLAEKLVAEIAETGGSALAIAADSADPEAARTAVERTAAELGGLDIVVNNAGIANGGPVENLTVDDFDQIVAVNVRSVFVTVRAALAHLGAGGRIITIGSINADRVPVPGLSLYAMTKAAVAGLTRGLARELGGRGITVNNLQVGPTETDMNPGTGDFGAQARAQMALGEYAQPADIASAVAYLARPEAHYITGANWNVDGGYTV
ncbi:3-oxoacyl-ACP reductase family protein [Kutzneria sp. NPDC052558]|uniref:3-oxoacyl-ACP reductase family protein n=1 Tax=Kutzneria sp. NPDC052558 TaxID=3364121 RepID=UPI0037CC30D1